jgi:hypothetical protein
MRMTPFMRSAEMNKRSMIITSTFIVRHHRLHVGLMASDQRANSRLRPSRPYWKIYHGTV